MTVQLQLEPTVGKNSPEQAPCPADGPSEQQSSEMPSLACKLPPFASLYVSTEGQLPTEPQAAPHGPRLTSPVRQNKGAEGCLHYLVISTGSIKRNLREWG